MADMTLTDHDFESLRARLHRAIPGGAHTYSRGDDQFPAIAPPLFVRGKGAYTWDSAGNRFLDYGMALRAVTLGYADPRVNAAAAAEMEKGVNLTRATLTELQAAEALIDLIPSVEMVKFGKNGSNVTTAAIKIARAYTGRRYVCVPRQQPFFSFDDWFIGTTALKRGIPADQTSATLVFDYNDIGTLKALFDAHPGEIAAVMLEPATTLTPCPPACTRKDGWPDTGTCAACDCNPQNFLQQVQALCRAGGALFVLDEMITGFRWHLQGAQTFFGVQPDLTTFGKGMANGFSVAAVGGRREPDARVRKERTDGAGDVVGGAVVDDHALPGGKALRLQRSQRLAEQVRDTVGRDDHRNPGRCNTCVGLVHVGVIGGFPGWGARRGLIDHDACGNRWP